MGFWKRSSIALSCLFSLTTGVIIRTPQGQLDGKIEKLDGYGEVTKFLGIPYAQPPVFGLRFKSPRKARPFRGVYDATYGRPMCPQPEAYLPLINLTKDPDIHFRTDENCLYLNVYIPSAVSRGTNFPVMVWIHGGSWQWGSGTHYDGRKLAAMGKVIVVTLNYRLGVLGFLPDGSQASTLGLQDQIEALKWVRENIWSFGGDPGIVTIFGESAGGASVSYLAASPAAQYLFHRAISQSGLKASAWASETEAKRVEKMQAIGMKLRLGGCTRGFFDCIRSLSAQRLVELTQFVMSSLNLSAWTPHVDYHVVMSNVVDNSTWILPKVERMIGFNSDEGGTMMEYICSHNDGSGCQLYQGISYQSVRRWIVPDMDLMTFEKIGKQYMTWYPGPKRFNSMSLSAASAFSTDWFERFPANRTASIWRDLGRKIYAYEFNVKPRGFKDLYVPVPWSEKAQHCDELPFLFAAVQDPEDVKISQKIIKIWTDFAKGEPLPWPQFGPGKNYRYFAREGDVTKRPLVSPRKERFWQPWFTDGEFPEVASIQSSGSRLGGLPMSGLSMVSVTLCMYSRFFR